MPSVEGPPRARIFLDPRACSHALQLQPNKAGRVRQLVVRVKAEPGPCTRTAAMRRPFAESL